MKATLRIALVLGLAIAAAVAATRAKSSIPDVPHASSTAIQLGSSGLG